jgi:hypothetical protein
VSTEGKERDTGLQYAITVHFLTWQLELGNYKKSRSTSSTQKKAKTESDLDEGRRKKRSRGGRWGVGTF